MCVCVGGMDNGGGGGGDWWGCQVWESRWKAGWQASACLDSFSIPFQGNDKEGGGLGGWVSVGEGQPSKAILQAKLLLSSTAVVLSFYFYYSLNIKQKEVGQKKEWQMMQRKKLWTPMISHFFFFFKSLQLLIGIITQGLRKPVRFQMTHPSLI